MTGITQPEPALVLFSGGQDSTTCLAWALDRFAQVETIGFDYGQRHRVELECRGQHRATGCAANFPNGASRLGDDHVLDLGVLGQISDTALTHDRAIAFEQSGLPTTFVPGRNLLFFTFAAALAYRRGIRHLVGGMCETDYSGYPDCRDDTLKALQATLWLGMDQRFVIETPLMWLDKAATWALARDLGGARAGRADPRGDAHLLPRRPHAPPRLGLRLRRLPGLRICAGGGGKCVRRMAHDLRRQGDLLHAAGRGGADRAAGRVLPVFRLQSVVRARGGPGRRDLHILRHRFRRHGRHRRRPLSATPTRWPTGSRRCGRKERRPRFVVCTGGEPLLQLDPPLIDGAARPRLRDRDRDQRHDPAAARHRLGLRQPEGGRVARSSRQATN